MDLVLYLGIDKFSWILRVWLPLLGLILRSLIMRQPWKKCITRAKGAVIRNCITRVILVRDSGSQIKLEVLGMGTLYNSLISIKISLVGLFILHFIFLTGSAQLQ